MSALGRHLRLLVTVLGLRHITRLTKIVSRSVRFVRCLECLGMWVINGGVAPPTMSVRTQPASGRERHHETHIVP